MIGTSIPDDISSIYIPEVENSFQNIDLESAFIENELSKEGLSVRGNFKDENEYTEYLEQNYKIIDNFKEYIRKVLNAIYGSNESKIESMIHSIMNIEEKVSSILIDVKWYEVQPIYATETINYDDITEVETMNYNNDYNDEIDLTMNTESLNDDMDDVIIEDSITNIKSFNEKYPLINWKLYLEKRFELFNIETQITEESSLIKEDNDFKYLYKYLNEINNNDLANYIEWKCIEAILEIASYDEMLKYLITDELYQIKKEYEKSKEDKVENDEDEGYNIMKNKFKSKKNKRKESKKFLIKKIISEENENTQCLNFVLNAMPFAFDKYYVKMYFPENIKTETKEMIENIRNSMILRIQELEWLDESTRKYAIEKVLKIKYQLGYYDYFMNVENIYNLYKPLLSINNDYISLLMYLQTVYERMIFANFYNEESNDDSISLYEIIPSYVLNAFYRPSTNTMIFPAAILQSPFYDVNQPDYLNYSNVGRIIGHELVHAFDNSGKNYDAEGIENNWVS
eukprot:jgi/Orpsp1_1/1191260/evm.model.d7180000084513.1